MRIVSDLHTHTKYSHGHGTPEENVRAAVERGLGRIAISEHGPGHLFYGVRGSALLSLRREIDDLARRYQRDVEVLMGIECDLTGFGRCDLPADASMFDVKLLGFHKGIFPRDNTALRCLLEAGHIGHNDPVQTANALLAAAERYKIDAITHPSLYAVADPATLARGAAQLGVLLEINGHHPVWSAEELRLGASLGARYIINSDAHRPENVGNFTLALARAEEAGLTAKQIGNAE